MVPPSGQSINGLPPEQLVQHYFPGAVPASYFSSFRAIIERPQLLTLLSFLAVPRELNKTGPSSRAIQMRALSLAVGST